MPEPAENQPDHSDLVILDAGPILNFMGRNETTDLYLKTLKMMTASIVVPDAVVDEVERKSGKDKRFATCRKKLMAVIGGSHVTKLMTPERYQDDEYDFHWTWVINNCPESMLSSGKNRGEMVLIAHGLIQDKSQLKKLYGFVKDNDDGLLPFTHTDLKNEFPKR